jgi:hypothetical protein
VIEGTRFALFVSAAAILALTPGPGILYALGRTRDGGRRGGVFPAQAIRGRKPTLRGILKYTVLDLADGIERRISSAVLP